MSLNDRFSSHAVMASGWELYEPWISRGGIKLGLELMAIIERRDRLLCGLAEPGDLFGLMRSVIRLFKSARTKPVDLAWLAIQLGRTDEDTTLPWQLILRDRPETALQREAKRRLRARERRAKLAGAENSLFLRVEAWRVQMGCSLQRAFADVGAGLDGPLGLLQIKPQIVSAAKVRAAYQSELKRARALGYITERHGMFASRVSKRPLPPKAKPGRPRKIG